jgi:hypothetical protein
MSFENNVLYKSDTLEIVQCDMDINFLSVSGSDREEMNFGFRLYDEIVSNSPHYTMFTKGAMDPIGNSRYTKREVLRVVTDDKYIRIIENGVLIDYKLKAVDIWTTSEGTNIYTLIASILIHCI